MCLASNPTQVNRLTHKASLLSSDIEVVAMRWRKGSSCSLTGSRNRRWDCSCYQEQEPKEEEEERLSEAVELQHHQQLSLQKQM
jgi:hypothetical protein